jgi:hypothetical protein
MFDGEPNLFPRTLPGRETPFNLANKPAWPLFAELDWTFSKTAVNALVP